MKFTLLGLLFVSATCFGHEVKSKFAFTCVEVQRHEQRSGEWPHDYRLYRCHNGEVVCYVQKNLVTRSVVKDDFNWDKFNCFNLR